VHLALVGAFPFPFPQGSQVYFAEQARSLAAVGVRVTLVCYGAGEGRAPADLPLVRAPFAPRRLHSGPSAGKPVADLALAATLVRAHRRDPFDAVLAHNAEAALTALLARRVTRVPVVYVAHTVLRHELETYANARLGAPLRALGAGIDRCVARRADAVIALSRAAEQELSAYAPGRVVRIPPGLAPAAAPGESAIEAACARFGLARGRYALYAGNLDGYQDLDVLASAARETCAPIVIATHAPGDAPAPLVTARVADAGEARALTFGAGIALLARRAPGGFPIKLLNYMEAGRAIVARASIADPLVHDRSGWLVPDAAPARTWSDAVHALRADPLLAARLGSAARRVLEAEHDPASLAHRVVTLIETIVAKRR
jgi:glycosyltransferase involved in cell wall biosynthesis